MWMLLGIVSALFLGFYDIAKKYGVRDNAVLPVLFFSTLSGSALMIPVFLGSWLAPDWMRSYALFIPPIDGMTHLALFLKSFIVSASWIGAYFAIKHLPISIVSPIRASAPLWTFVAAVAILGERPSGLQVAGMAIVFISYYAFAVMGKREGIQFHKNVWVGCIVLATLLGTASAVYDKYLIATLKIPPMAVQAWFAVYLVVILGAVVLTLWVPKRGKYTPFSWRWSIPLIGVLLIAADYAYFFALGEEGAMLSVLSILRRSGVVISFAVGGLLLRETGKRGKGLALAGVLAGLLLIMMA